MDSDHIGDLAAHRGNGPRRCRRDRCSSLRPNTSPGVNLAIRCLCRCLCRRHAAQPLHAKRSRANRPPEPGAALREHG